MIRTLKKHFSIFTTGEQPPLYTQQFNSYAKICPFNYKKHETMPITQQQ